MADITALPVEERLLDLLQELRIAQVHIVARDAADWQSFVGTYPDRVASLILLCPIALDPRGLVKSAQRALVITGDRGTAAEGVIKAVEAIDGVRSFTLRDYEALMLSDLAADRAGDIGPALLDFLRRIDRDRPISRAHLLEGEGEIDGVSYRIQGSGPPLVLMPLLLSPSQWEPLLPALSEHYCTIVLGGAFLGSVAMLEARGRGVYLGMIRTLLDIARIRPGEAVLDVGCGTGVVIREIARRAAGANRLFGLDMSPYLLREARALAAREGYANAIEFRDGRAEALPFADAIIDVTLASTVLEEGNAARMLAELIRVTKPGGRIGVVVRAVDIPGWVNLPLPAATRAKVEAPGLFGGGVVAGGCADASLYARFRAAGLTELSAFPQLTALAPDDPRLPMFQQQALAALSGSEIPEWRRAVTEAAGTSFIAMPHHCAVGTKP